MVLIIRANPFQQGEIDYLAPGSDTVPSLRFANDPGTGLYNPTANVLGIAAGGQTAMQIDDQGNVSITGFLTANGLERSMTVSNVSILDGSPSLLSNSSVDQVCLVQGTGFISSQSMLCTVGDTNATATTRLDESNLRVHVPPKPSGTYDLTVIRRQDGATVTIPSALSYSDQVVELVTPTDLGTVQINTAFSIPIQAVSANADPIVYANLTTLPPETTLDPTSGNVVGNITTVTDDTLYSFIVRATDGASDTTSKTYLLNVQA